MKQQTDITEINQETWSELFKLLVRDEDSSLENVCFRSEYNGYAISFYAWADSGYALQVEVFGVNQENGWTNIEPSIHQIEAMENAISKEISRLQEIEDEEELERMECGNPDNYNFYKDIKKRHHERVN